MENENPESKKSVAKDTSEIENGKDRNSQELDKQTDSTTELGKRSETYISVLEQKKETEDDLGEDASDLEKRIFRNTSLLKKRMKRSSYELKNGKDSSDKEKRTDSNASELEKTTEGRELETLRVVVELERRTGVAASELEKGIKGSGFEKETLKDDLDLEKKAGELEKRNEHLSLNSDGKDNFPDETIEKVDETGVPLLVGDAVSIEMKGGPEGKPTVHVHAKSKEAAAKKKATVNPIQRMKTAWSTSSNVFTFFFRAILIIFTTLGWMMCVGGIPFVSIAMIAIGSLYFDDCRVQPNIPLYLVVSGVCGTVQHFIAFWNKYLPEESQGPLKKYRRCYSLIDGAMTLFLFVWFILGCVWIYGVKEVDFQDDYKDEYCHKTLYYFSFWLLNISFIIIAVVMVLGLCAILCVVAIAKEEAVV